MNLKNFRLVDEYGFDDSSEIEHEGRTWDLHNDGSFTGFELLSETSLVFNWRMGYIEGGLVASGPLLSLKFDGLKEFRHELVESGAGAQPECLFAIMLGPLATRTLKESSVVLQFMGGIRYLIRAESAEVTLRHD